MACSPKVVGNLAGQMLGYALVTKQTPPEGVVVNKVVILHFFPRICAPHHTQQQCTHGFAHMSTGDGGPGPRPCARDVLCHPDGPRLQRARHGQRAHDVITTPHTVQVGSPQGGMDIEEVAE